MAFKISGKKGSGGNAGQLKQAAGAPSWMKRGAAAQSALAQEEQQREAARAAASKMRRLYVAPDSEVRVTFIAGDLVQGGPQEGMLDVVYVQQHKVTMPGRKVPDYYVCVADEETCPLCESGNRPLYVGLFPVIDHSEWKDRRGNLHKHERRILAAKSTALKKLAKLAKKADGSLAGCTVDISRTGSQSPTEGDDFDLVGQNSLEAIGRKIDNENWQELVAEPDWTEELNYLPGEELAKLVGLPAAAGPGYGGASTGAGVSFNPNGEAKTPPASDDDIPF